jgi:hypothetical protein
MLRILICASQDWYEEEPIRKGLEKYTRTEEQKNPVILIGGCSKADMIVLYIAKELGLQTEIYFAQWDIYGKEACDIRNKQMLEEGNPTLVLAFSKHLKTSKDINSMITRAKNMDIKVVVHTMM